MGAVPIPPAPAAAPGAGPPPDPAAPPRPTASQEIRLALVLYGGVSLAIYINGIVQEFLELVSATAPGAPPPAADSPGAVYRRLGQLLGWARGPDFGVPAEAPVTTRFVVDVVSGTSAGGINGIFLAKALATGRSMAPLEALWVREADLDLLLNDKGSQTEPWLRQAGAPQGLLNGGRMYIKLVEAFNAIDEAPVCAGGAALADEIDLFVTTTDIRGAEAPIELANTVATEKVHRHVFHHKFATAHASGAPINEFLAPANPALAFAARCTSSFPFAFEPFTLADANRLLAARWPGVSLDAGGLLGDYAAWNVPAAEWPGIAFGDGGYLDNKPFSYAIAALKARRADAPVVRKLIFIDPAPEVPAPRQGDPPKPDALENTIAAAFTIPRYETIREDLQSILDRNRRIERQKVITDAAESDFALMTTLDYHAPAWDDLPPERRDLARYIAVYGPGYGPYHRLRVAAVTDDLAELVTRVAGLQENSDEAVATRKLVAAWRERRYTAYLREAPPAVLAPAGPPPLPESIFLRDFDVDYRLRRLQFLLHKADDLARPDLDRDEASLSTGVDLATALRGEAGWTRFVQALGTLRVELGGILTELRRVGRTLRSRGAGNPVAGAVRATHLDPARLRALLAPSRAGLLEGLNAADVEALDNVARVLEGELRAAFTEAGRRLTRLLEPAAAAGPREGEMTPEAAAAECLLAYHRAFELYDMTRYPVLSTLDVGEAAPVEVIRFSPRDARSLVDETDLARGRRKLAGTSLYNFGAFLRRTWRENDILWGRLDAAEQILTSHLPPGPERDGLLTRLHEAILRDYLEAGRLREWAPLLARGLGELAGGPPEARRARDYVEAALGGPPALVEKLTALIRACLSAPQWREYLRTTYEVDRRADPQRSVRFLGRGASITGRLFEQIARARAVSSRPAALVARLGDFLTGFAQLAIPDSILGTLARRWLNLLYLLAALMLVGGTLWSRPVFGMGLLLLALLLMIHLGLLFLADLFRGKAWRRNVAVVLLGVALVVPFALGLGWLVVKGVRLVKDHVPFFPL